MTAEGAARVRAQAFSLPVGTYRYDVRADRWVLGRACHEILGLAPSQRVGTAHLLGLVAVEEREAAAALVMEALGAREPFAGHVHVGDDDREVVVVGQGEHDAGGTLVAVSGQVVDVGRVTASRVNAAMDEKVAEVVAHRATIEQAKGVLSLAYGFDEDAAIALLRWWSSHRNVKVHDLAGRLVRRAATGAASSPPLRASIDELLAVVTSTPAQDGQPS